MYYKLSINKVCLFSPYQISNDFAFGLYDLDWDVFSTHIEGAVNRVPVIGETGVKSTVCGPGTVELKVSWEQAGLQLDNHNV